MGWEVCSSPSLSRERKSTPPLPSSYSYPADFESFELSLFLFCFSALLVSLLCTLPRAGKPRRAYLHPLPPASRSQEQGLRRGTSLLPPANHFSGNSSARALHLRVRVSLHGTVVAGVRTRPPRVLSCHPASLRILYPPRCEEIRRHSTDAFVLLEPILNSEALPRRVVHPAAALAGEVAHLSCSRPLRAR